MILSLRLENMEEVDGRDVFDSPSSVLFFFLFEPVVIFFANLE